MCVTLLEERAFFARQRAIYKSMLEEQRSFYIDRLQKESEFYQNRLTKCQEDLELHGKVIKRLETRLDAFRTETKRFMDEVEEVIERDEHQLAEQKEL